MQQLVLITLATLWVWETIRFAAETYTERAFRATRILHPVVVLILPLWVLWPAWIEAMAVAGAVGLFHLFVARLVETPVPVQIPRRRRDGLPPLP